MFYLKRKGPAQWFVKLWKDPLGPGQQVKQKPKHLTKQKEEVNGTSKQ
jgi:hypothetical protein